MDEAIHADLADAYAAKLADDLSDALPDGLWFEWRNPPIQPLGQSPMDHYASAGRIRRWLWKRNAYWQVSDRFWRAWRIVSRKA